MLAVINLEKEENNTIKRELTPRIGKINSKRALSFFKLVQISFVPSIFTEQKARANHLSSVTYKRLLDMSKDKRII